MKPQNWFLNLALLLLLALGFGVRLYDLTDQPIDFHPTRQLRGAIVARGLYYEMSPEADPILRQQALAFWKSTGQYEPSILESLVAATYLVTGQENIWIARLYTSLFWLVAGFYLFRLARRMGTISTGDDNPEVNTRQTVTSALGMLAYFLFLPFAVQASRSFQPDPGMVMWLVLFVSALYQWSENPKMQFAVLAGLFAGLAILTKAVVIFPVAGTALALVLYNHRRKPWQRLLFNRQVWAMAVLMVAPIAAYYLVRAGRASEYLSSWTLALSHLLLDPMFYLRWLNLIQELVGWLALVLAGAGILIAKDRDRLLLLGLWGGYIVYGLFLPYQMYTHSYYHLMLVPIVALSLVPVFQAISQRILFSGSKAWGILILTVALVWIGFNVRSTLLTFNNQNYRDEPAYWQNIASQLPQDGKIIALTQDYGYRLMYYGWRKVVLWPNRGEISLNILRGSDKEFETYFAKRTQDKSYFLITAFRQFDEQPKLKTLLYQNYPILAESQGYIIFDLGHPKNLEAGEE